MKRRRFPKLRPAKLAAHHHHVYVVLLDNAVLKDRAFCKANPRHDPAKPCIYVGMTGLPPIERFWNHQEGYQSSRFVHRYGIQLLPEMFHYLNPMPYDAACQMEKELAEELRAQGYGVCGGQ